jgi:hypothetical protein
MHPKTHVIVPFPYRRRVPARRPSDIRRARSLLHAALRLLAHEANYPAAIDAIERELQALRGGGAR